MINANMALDYVHIVVYKFYKFGEIPSQWGRLYKSSQLSIMIETYPSLDDVAQDLSVMILEYFHEDHPDHDQRIVKLFEAGDGRSSPLLSVQAINMVLNKKTFDFPKETPFDPARLPSRV